MKEKDKENLIKMLPTVILIVSVGTLTHYNLLYVVPAGVIGSVIGYYLLQFIKNRKNKK